MEKELSEMTQEELWQLFPIFLVEPDPNWDRRYDEMESLLTEALRDCGAVRVSHVGSTAIRGIWAKNIVDIMVELEKGADMDAAAERIAGCGFRRMCAEENRIFFNRGYTKRGFAERVYHLHLRFAGDNDELYFRDYMNDHPALAKEYERLKLDLWKRFEHDRDGYTEAKTRFIREHTERAKVLYKGRYE